MKRRHESTVEHTPRLQPEDTENAPRRIFKKRRTINNDNWGGLGRRRSLRDINNLSGHPTSISHDEKTTSKVTQSKTSRGSPISSAKETIPTPNVSPIESNIPLHGSCSEHQPTLPNSRQPTASVPVRRTSVLRSAPSPSTGASGSEQTLSFPRFVSHDKPVRITQSGISRQTRSSNQHLDLDSDQEDESSDSDEESEDEELSPGTETVDGDEKQRVESNYSEINKLLGDLFLSRHRNHT
ncbi:hypothetical protein B0J17DRAFT_638694 [Rhizoctonia solani]|nr:hypothetical protein B0J17DRAFT_638694 [Rhizoctonia solani]